MTIPVYTVDTGVPIPEDRYGAGITTLMNNLNVGESFLFPISNRPTAQSYASFLKKTEHKVFTIRKVDNDNARVWRKE